MLRVSLLFLVVSSVSLGQKIRCYQCLAPKDAVQLSNYCVDTNYCTGTYCFKGPDTTSTGIVHGCIDTPPIDQKVGICKVYNASAVKHNCYCKNQDFCNSSPVKFPGVLALPILLWAL